MASQMQNGPTAPAQQQGTQTSGQMNGSLQPGEQQVNQGETVRQQGGSGSPQMGNQITDWASI